MKFTIQEDHIPPGGAITIERKRNGTVLIQVQYANRWVQTSIKETDVNQLAFERALIRAMRDLRTLVAESNPD